jgi:Fe2+ or Zn2+ uptake regulation protein
MEKYREISQWLKNIKSPVKLGIIKTLCEDELSLNELFEKVSPIFEIKYPQTIYNYLEDMIKIGLIKKFYDNNEKLIKYKSKVKRLSIDFEKLELNLD